MSHWSRLLYGRRNLIVQWIKIYKTGLLFMLQRLSFEGYYIIVSLIINLRHSDITSNDKRFKHLNHNIFVLAIYWKWDDSTHCLADIFWFYKAPPCPDFIKVTLTMTYEPCITQIIISLRIAIQMGWNTIKSNCSALLWIHAHDKILQSVYEATSYCQNMDVIMSLELICIVGVRVGM